MSANILQITAASFAGSAAAAVHSALSAVDITVWRNIF